MINSSRLIKEFCRLVEIDSVSFDERKMSDYIKSVFKDLDIELIEDKAGEYYNGTAGNLFGVLKGTLPGSPVLFSAHMDTVEPGKGKKAVLHNNGVITSDGTTVLGADDAAGLAAIIEGIRTIKENNIPHRDIELLFPVAEEVYIKGTSVFDFGKVKAKQAYVLDLSGKTGTAALRAPTLISFSAEVKGRASHAGFAPTEGINAIAAAALAISNIKQGELEDGSTLNIGTIQGGSLTNIISEKCSIKGELRSLNHKRAISLLEEVKTSFERACENYGAGLDFEYSIDLTAYETDINSKTVREYVAVCKELGIKTELVSTFGGSDNNNFAKNGIEGIVIACGMNNVHSCEEYTTVSDLSKTAEIVLKLMTRGESNENPT